MPIRLLLAGRSPIELDDEYITLGSDPYSTVCFTDVPQVKSRHATIRLLDGRWIIEAAEAESLTIGASGAKRAHWISSGDVVSLSSTGPSMIVEVLEIKVQNVEKVQTVEPVHHVPPVAKSPKTANIPTAPRAPKVESILADDDDIPLRLASDSTPRKASARAEPLSDSDPLIPSTSSHDDHPLLPTNHPSSPRVAASKSSETVPSLKASSAQSTTIRSTDSQTSKSIRVPKTSADGIPTTKSPTSGTVVPPKTSTSIPSTGKSASKSSSSHSNIPIKRAGHKPATPQISLDDLDDDVGSERPPAAMPMLRRLSEYEMPAVTDDFTDDVGFDDGFRRRRTNHSADIDWIKMIIFRSLIGGAIVLVLFIAGRELWKSMGPQSSAPSTPMEVPRN